MRLRLNFRLRRQSGDLSGNSMLFLFKKRSKKLFSSPKILHSP
jgi:hypothetical protein